MHQLVRLHETLFPGVGLAATAETRDAVSVYDWVAIWMAGRGPIRKSKCCFLLFVFISDRFPCGILRR